MMHDLVVLISLLKPIQTNQLHSAKPPTQIIFILIVIVVVKLELHNPCIYELI